MSIELEARLTQAEWKAAHLRKAMDRLVQFKKTGDSWMSIYDKLKAEGYEVNSEWVRFAVTSYKCRADA